MSEMTREQARLSVKFILEDLEARTRNEPSYIARQARRLRKLIPLLVADGADTVEL
jgi:hypothetical protein